MILKGRVVTGTGNYAYWLEKLQDVYSQKTGMLLFYGTLNVQLEVPYHFPAKKVIRLEKEEYSGTVSVSIVPCKLMGVDSFLLRTDKAAIGGDEETSILEVASSIKFRDVYNLKDGDIVKVEVFD